MKFTVRHGGIRLKVETLPTAQDVHKKFHDGVDRRDGSCVYSFFEAGGVRYTGIIYLAENARLYELVPHEVCHAVIHHYKEVSHEDDEKFCMAVGMLSAQILNKIEDD